MSTAQRTYTPLLIAFIDLTGFSAQMQRVEDAEAAEVLDAFYDQVASAVRAAGGKTVKFIGDAALAVFPESAADAAARMLLELKGSVDRTMQERGWPCRFTAKAHFGTAIAGEFGPVGDKRFDVIGRAVNTAAVLESIGVTLSVEAFRKLSPALRKHFKKNTWPITYIRHDDPRPFRRKGGRAVWAV